MRLLVSLSFAAGLVAAVSSGSPAESFATLLADGNTTTTTTRAVATAGAAPTPRPTGGNRRRIWQPRVRTKYQMILSGVLDVNQNSTRPRLTPNVPVYDIDLFDNPPEAMAALRKAGKKVICYFSAGTWEQWRPDIANFSEAVLGAQLPLWPGERWLDVRNNSVFEAMKYRLNLAKEKGCDAVDPDNIGRRIILAILCARLLISHH